MARLTKAQRDLLQECCNDERGMTGVASSYAPARILVQRKLSVWLHDDPYSDRLIITDAGRAALKDTPNGQ